MAVETPQPPPSILATLGEEIVRIITPVSACMLIVVFLVSALSSPSSSPSPPLVSIATVAYAESAADSPWDKLRGALFDSLIFVAVLTTVTFFLVLLFYFRCTAFLRYYMVLSSFVVLALLGGEIWIFLLQRFEVPVDCVTFLVVLLNFAVVGAAAVLASKGLPIVVTQGYLVLVGVLVAYWFTLLPEWTTWALLAAMAVYDLAAVLLPVGPLRLLVELAISRDEEIPALVYEARPVEYHHASSDPGIAGRRRLWRDSDPNPNTNLTSLGAPPNLGMLLSSEDTRLVAAEEGNTRDSPTASELMEPLVHRQLDRRGEEDAVGIGLGSSGAIKLGLGDFIFYSVLVGRAAMYDFMTVYACYLAIIAGLGITLLLLAFYRKALPALPVSIVLGMLFYFLTRVLLEVFVVQCSLNLIMF